MWLRISCDRHKEPTQQGAQNFCDSCMDNTGCERHLEPTRQGNPFFDVAVWIRDKPVNARSEARAQVPRERCTTSYAN